ncbi:MAG: hypothetical protein H0W02_23035 [Ktedonobacteraceae bacterium]|nr:hypothetical protein [Ktedonobacteraceae bacterium]
MEDALSFVHEDPGDPRDSYNAKILRGYGIRLEQMREMVLFKFSQRRITQASIDELESALNEIIGGLDRLRRVPAIDEVHSSLDEVQALVRKARKCLNVAAGLLEKAHSPRYLEALFQKFEEFADFLGEAIEILNV